MKKVLFATFEALPFVKTGGLADVVYALPKYLDQNKFDVRIVLPLFKTIKERYIQQLESIGHIYVRCGYINEEANILTYKYGGVEYLFIENDTYFYRDGIYGYDDDAARFSFYNLAIIEMFKVLNYYPDIVHAHDYHCGVLSALCKLKDNGDDSIRSIKHIFTIHNLAYQGIFDKKVLFELLGFDYCYYADGTLRFNDCTNFMKIGIVCADKITTVSNTYALEIQSPQFGEGLDALLKYRRDDLIGIINGIDTSLFNPESDVYLYANYHSKAFKRNKQKCKRSLQYELGLNDNSEILVVGMVSRLTYQKGINLILDEIHHIMKMNVQVVVLGSGETNYEYAFKNLENQYKGRFVYYCGYNETLAHKIYAGIDMLLMPSLFEPCGISQLIAMRYGSLPLVRETGGLKDTVEPYNMYTKKGRGFSFTNFNSFEFKQIFDMAYDVYYHNHKDWDRMIKNAMNYDVSFKLSAKEYELLYNSEVNDNG
ncbi:MAG: glycogen synthase [Erysipelotrichaceae bacterium]|nr:glycogen synthase [Erysipelotrichaceae bacterium]